MRRVLLLIACLLVPSSAFAKATGVDSRQEFPPVGCGSAADGENLGCHVMDADPQLTVTIDGPTQMINPQETYTASVPVDFMSLKGAGINVAIAPPNTTGCQLDTLSPVGKFGPKNDSFDPNDFVLSHLGNDTPPTNLIGVWSYQFLVLNCTTPGTLMLEVAMNVFDGDGTELGELWNRASLAVTVPEPGGASLAAAAVASLAAIGVRRRR